MGRGEGIGEVRFGLAVTPVIYPLDLVAAKFGNFPSLVAATVYRAGFNHSVFRNFSKGRFANAAYMPMRACLWMIDHVSQDGLAESVYV